MTKSLESGVPDLAQDVCLVLPALLFYRLINRPDEEAFFLARVSDEILKIFEQNPANRDSVIRAGTELKAYTDDLVAERRANPGDDLISYLIGKQQQGMIPGRNSLTTSRCCLRRA